MEERKKRSEAFEKGYAVYTDMVSEIATADGKRKPSFAEELGAMSIESVFGAVWSREGLDRRSRSIATLGMLIALGAEDELKIHLKIARKNGVSAQEIKEIIYQSACYAGFPAAAKASHIAAETFTEE